MADAPENARTIHVTRRRRGPRGGRRTLSPDAQERQMARFRARWHAFSVGFTSDQGAALRYVTERYRLSLAELVDRALTYYVPRHFGMPWPQAQRDKKRWRLHEYKVKPSHTQMGIYGLLFNDVQKQTLDKVLAILGNEQGAFSALIDDALTVFIPLFYHVPWPEAPRRFIMPRHRRAG